MTMERLKLLDALGFVWNAPRGAKRKRHVMTSENESSYIPDRTNQSVMVECEVSDSVKANNQSATGLNEYSCGGMKGKGNVEGNPRKHDSRLLFSPDSNNVNQGMYR